MNNTSFDYTKYLEKNIDKFTNINKIFIFSIIRNENILSIHSVKNDKGEGTDIIKLTILKRIPSLLKKKKN